MFNHHLEEATEWSVFWDQGLGDIDLVIPKAYHKDAAVGIDNTQYDDRRQLCIVGLAYTVTTGAGPLGVRLVQTIPSTNATRTIWECASATAAVVTGGFRCKWPLSPAGAGSPAMDPGRLSVVKIGSVLSAQLTITIAYLNAMGRSDLWLTPTLTLAD